MFRFLFRGGVFFIVSLMISVLGPFLWFDPQWKTATMKTIQPTIDKLRSLAGGKKTNSDSWRTELSVGKSLSGNFGADDWLVGRPVNGLGEVIRFDISPGWVTSRWPRVSTVRSESGMTGMRVPLVTGTQLKDIAGSLTYFFDENYRVQRVSFQGYTGDPRPLTMLVTQAFHLQPDRTSDGYLYVARWNGTPTSVMRIRHTAVVRAGSNHTPFEVNMEINRPSYQYRLSRGIQQQLAHEF
jgi:hypothetical protein